MITQAIQHQFTPDELAAAASAAAVMQELFSFCTALDPRERHDLYKLGPRTESFVTRIVEVAQQHLDLLPRGMDIDDLAARVQTRETLRLYYAQLQPLILRMQHSIMLLGAEILQDSLKAYKTLKVNGQEEGLRELLAEIGQRFYTKKAKRKEGAATGTVQKPTKPETSPKEALQAAPASVIRLEPESSQPDGTLLQQASHLDRSSAAGEGGAVERTVPGTKPAGAREEARRCPGRSPQVPRTKPAGARDEALRCPEGAREYSPGLSNAMPRVS